MNSMRHVKQGAGGVLGHDLARMGRYEREYGRGQRSVLKKVLEQDERASRAMILCVAEVLRPSSAQQGPSRASAQQGDSYSEWMIYLHPFLIKRKSHCRSRKRCRFVLKCGWQRAALKKGL